MKTLFTLIDSFLASNDRGWRNLDSIEHNTQRGIQSIVYEYEGNSYLSKASLVETDRGTAVKLKLTVNEDTFYQIFKEISIVNVSPFTLLPTFSNTEMMIAYNNFIFHIKSGCNEVVDTVEGAYKIVKATVKDNEH